MPVIKVSAQEIKRGLPVKEDWYKASVKSIQAEPSKDKASINYKTVITIDDGTHEGRDISDQFNTKFMAPFGQFYGAITGKAIDPNNIQDLEIDSDMLIGKQLKLKVKNDVYNGSLIPKFGAFLPINVDTDSVPF